MTVASPSASGLPLPTRVITAGQFCWPLGPRVLTRSREVLLRLVLRELQVRYRQTALGVLWALLQPAAAMALFTFVLGQGAGFPSESLPYSVFALSALVVWSYFANCLIHGAVTLVENAEMIRQTAIPRALLPFAVVVSKLVDLAAGFVLLVIWTAVTHPVRPSARWALLPPLLLAGVAFTTGMTLLVSAACVRYRDMRYAVPFLSQIWFFATPIVYSTTIVAPANRWVFLINPVAAWVDATRTILFSHRPLDWLSLGTAVGGGALAFLLGSLYFRRVERTFADVI
jgi:lipopolysaccharide transport system permease protein